MLTGRKSNRDSSYQHSEESLINSTCEDFNNSKKTKVDVSVNDGSSCRKYSSSDEEWSGERVHAFSEPAVAEYWRKHYEDTKYENRHLFDPKIIWSKDEERKVIRKADIRALLWAFIMFVALDVDRFNLKNAIADNLLKDVGITKKDYNLGNTLNLVFFLIAELPSQLISKAVGPQRFLPTQVCLWSIAAICQCQMKNRASYLTLRCLVGFFEGGFLPEIITWLSYFYTHAEFTSRLSYFYLANPITQAFSGLLAAAIINLRGRGGWAGWQYVFLIEGLITLAVGLLSYQMPAGPASTKAWYRPKGWYTDREEKIMANRILRDDPSKGSMSNRQGITFPMFWQSLCDYDMWPLYICRFSIEIITTPLSQYMPFILRGMHYTSVQTNLLMVPQNALTIVTTLTQCWLARHFNQTGLALLITPFWNVIPIGVMRWWPNFLKDRWGSYALLLISLSFPPQSPLTASWTSANSYSVARRTVSAALLNMFSQAGNIAASNVFQPHDAPRYSNGLSVVFSMAIVCCCFVIATRSYYAWRNYRREQEWSRMSLDEQVSYLHNTSDQGNKRLNFRFQL